MTASTTASTATRPGLVARALLVLVRLYRRLTAHRPSPCRYDPTCSAYALDALEHHGAAKGTWLTIRRLSRCHPWGGQGWDPAPPTTSQVKV